MKRNLLNKHDIIIVGVLLLISASIFRMQNYYSEEARLKCKILIDDEEVKMVNLAIDNVFALEQNPAVHFEVKDGAIAFTESDCPDKICVKSGFLKQPGQAAACIPNHILIVITGDSGEEDNVDIISH